MTHPSATKVQKTQAKAADQAVANKFNVYVTLYQYMGNDMTDAEKAALRQAIYDLLSLPITATTGAIKVPA